MRHTNGPKKPANVLKDFIDPETKRNPFDTPTFREKDARRADENANLVHSSVLLRQLARHNFVDAFRYSR